MTDKTRAVIPDEPPWRISEFLLRWETVLIGLLVLDAASTKPLPSPIPWIWNIFGRHPDF